MYAIVEIAGKQYKITEGVSINVDKLEPTEKEVIFDKVLMLVDSNEIKIGAPILNGVKVKAEVLGEVKGDKLVVFKWRRRKNSRKKNGHRAVMTRLKITKIEVN
ncbi:MAG: 50S ribosomal protein L21 [bacterium]